MLIGKQFVVSPLVDQNLNNRQNEILWRLLANPADNGQIYSHNLQQLANDFPQSGLLQALYARSAGGEHTGRAAVAFDPKALYVLINAYENLTEVPVSNIIQHTGSTINYADQSQLEETPVYNDFKNGEPEEIPVFEPTEENTGSPEVVEAADEVSEVEAISSQVELEEDKETIETLAIQPEEDQRAGTHAAVYEEEAVLQSVIQLHQSDTENDLDSVSEPVVEFISSNETEMPEAEPEQVFIDPALASTEIADGQDAVAGQFTNEGTKDIEDEVFDEIVGIDDISFSRGQSELKDEKSLTTETVPGPVAFDIQHEEVLFEEEPEALIPESVALSDFFVFERSEQIGTATEAETNTFINGQEPVSIAASEQVETETNHVSKYHDEQMPYTFLWWLDKTRKEHAGIYQPFKLDTSQAIKHTGDETLQQQYYENIFHVTTLSELDKGTTEPAVEFDEQRKEDRIIRKFIVEEPHISTPTGDKLDNENKARRSNEDQDELVTETLAKIYIDQMLYHKAISTYKKLLLKFPEKSRYFADQIEMLERKIN